MEKPFIIPIFIPQEGCPHRCVFCNQSSITGLHQHIPNSDEIFSLVNENLKFKRPNRNKTQIAFFGGNFLGLKKDHVRYLLSTTDQFVRSGKVDSIRFSTRPDTINIERLRMIEKYSVSTIEIGAQSMDDQVLEKSNRCHTALDTQKATQLLKDRNYEIGIQIMVGLPDDNERKAIDTAYKVSRLSPDFVRIYPTIVLSNSLLGKWYQNGKYQPLPLHQCVSIVKKIYLLFKSCNIPVVRMGLQPTTELNQEGTILAGPYHPAFGHLVYSAIYLDKIISILESDGPVLDEVFISVHPRNISRVRGIKNQNFDILTRRYNLKLIKLFSNDDLPENSITVNDKQALIP